MAIFYFSFQCENQTIEADKALTFPDLTSAISDAISGLQETAKSSWKAAHGLDVVAMNISDKKHALVATVTAKDALDGLPIKHFELVGS